MANLVSRIFGVFLVTIAATGCSDRDSRREQYTGHTVTIRSYPEGGEQEGTVVPWGPPSAFEIEAMEKLKTMVSPELYEAFARQRETSAIFKRPEGLDPEAQKLMDDILTDRVRHIRGGRSIRSTREWAAKRRRSDGEKPPAL